MHMGDLAITNGGQLDGFVVYFRAEFDDIIGFETRPGQRQTSWSNVFIRIPARRLNAGDHLIYSVAMVDLLRFNSWRVSLD